MNTLKNFVKRKCLKMFYKEKYKKIQWKEKFKKKMYKNKNVGNKKKIVGKNFNKYILQMK